MKYAAFYSFTGLFLAFTITTSTYSQNSSNAAPSEQQTEKIISSSNNELKTDSSVWNEINTKAIRNFIRKFENVSNARWFKSVTGLYVAYFATEDVRTWVYYDKKGDYVYKIRSYTEKQLLPKVRHLVKSSYYDFTIHYITEVSTDVKTAYYVKMADKTLWKTVKVVDGEMEVTEEFEEKVKMKVEN